MRSFKKFLALLTAVAVLLGTTGVPISASDKVTVAIDQDFG